MRQDPFPSPDGEEPGGSVPPPAAGTGPDAGDPGPREQGLFVCLPAENLDVTRFAQDGESDAMPPGPLLASVVHALAGQDGGGLAALSDDQLLGVIAATRRLESRIAWTQLAAVAEFAARRGAAARAGGPSRSGRDGFAADELACELRLTAQSAAGQIAYACSVSERLPRTFAALGAGQIHPVDARIIEDETSILSPADAAEADQILAAAAGALTFGQLRSLAHRTVLTLDPEAARKRKEAARRDAHVRRFREASGNAGLVAREMPCDEVLASWQHIEQRALDLRAAGLPGTLQELRVQAYLDLLQERDSRAAGPADGGGSSGPPDGPGSSDDPGDPGGPGGHDDPGNPGGPGRPGAARPGAPGPGPSIAALINITVPWSTATGQSETPGEAAGFGLLDAESVRDLVAAAARHPRTRWCLTVLNPDGTAAAHGCAAGRLGWRAGPQAAEALRALKLTVRPVIRGPCDHAQAEPRYRPSRLLQHLVTARNARCTAPGCGQPATRCDLDHTQPFEHGGPTCPCNIAPLCRHHHRCKQAEGWRLEQPQPGVLIWRVPSGRTYATTPTEYPV